MAHPPFDDESWSKESNAASSGTRHGHQLCHAKCVRPCHTFSDQTLALWTARPGGRARCGHRIAPCTVCLETLVSTRRNACQGKDTGPKAIYQQPWKGSAMGLSPSQCPEQHVQCPIIASRPESPALGSDCGHRWAPASPRLPHGFMYCHGQRTSPPMWHAFHDYVECRWRPISILPACNRTWRLLKRFSPP